VGNDRHHTVGALEQSRVEIKGKSNMKINTNKIYIQGLTTLHGQLRPAV